MRQLANTNIEGLIWVVIGVIWVIVQLAETAAKKRRKEQQDFDEPDEPVSPQESFAELLRKLGAQTEPVEIPPPPPWEPEPMPSFEAETPWMPGEIEPLPETPLVRVEQTEDRVLPATEKPSIDQVVPQPEFSSFRSSIPSIRMPSATLRINPAPSSDATPGRKGIGDRLALYRRNTLRRAMLYQAILGKPKALSPAPAFEHE